MPKGFVIVVSAPSGAGKSTLCKKVLKRLPHCRPSISCTTRPPRAGEKNGVDYYFLSEQEFRQKAQQGEFIEQAVVHGFHYGIPAGPLEKMLNDGYDVLLNIDIQGCATIRKIYGDGVFIFVTPSDPGALEKRLKQRGQDSQQEIAARLVTAKQELEQIKNYDYLIINDELQEAVKQLESIIIAEHHRLSRLAQEVHKIQQGPF